MEKDLREAYAALKLLRADLVQTRRDKRALENAVKYLEKNGPPPSASQTRSSRETQQMKEEDVAAAMRRFEERVSELQTEDNQQEDQEVEKLVLLNKIHGLTALVEQQKEQLEGRQFEADQVTKEKLKVETQLEEARAITESARKELQERTDKYEEERQQLERRLAAHAQTTSILKQQLVEKEEECTNWRTEQAKRELQHKQELQDMTEKLTVSAQLEQEERETQLRDAHQRQVFELQQKCAVLELQLSSEREKALQEKEEKQERYAETLRDLQTSCADLQAQVAASEAQLAKQERDNEAAVAEATERINQHEKAIRALSMEKKALQQEVREARQTTKLTEEELVKCRTDAELQRQDHAKLLFKAQLQRQALEAQLMASEDHKIVLIDTQTASDRPSLEAFHGLSDAELSSLPSVEQWSVLRSAVHELGDFLPNLQTLLGDIHEALTVCKRHTEALPVLCAQLQSKAGMASDSVVPTALSLLRFAAMLRGRQEDAPVTLKLVRTFYKRVLTALAQWFECDAASETSHGYNVPIPAFSIASRETALILQNWTSDRSKQVKVKRWLARMEAYPGLPPLRGVTAKEIKVVELPPEGCTLELEEMTLEVKDAFRLLLVPILKQNRALQVRVFTRYTGGQTHQHQRDRQGEDLHAEEKAWAMRIHVQGAARKATGATRPAPLKLERSPRGSPSPLAPTSPASSVSSSSSSNSSRLQIIQERLQYLHTTGI